MYCDFLSGPEHLKQIEEYVDMLLVEVKQYHDFIKQYKVRSIFLGGGTPSILSPEQISRIMNAIREAAGENLFPDAEITIESNPGTLTMDKLNVYQKLGINRISMGLQSTHDEELKLLGRMHTYEEFLQGYHMARKAGFQNINVDLMSGLPGQTLKTFEETLERIIALNPEHISAYSLIIEEGTRFYEMYGTEEGKKQLPDEETDRLIYHKTKEILKKAGYERYEISNYAKKGMESRHNLSYWTGIAYLGLGLGASSYFDNKRYYNEENMKYYLQALHKKESVLHLEETLTIQDKMEEFMILGLRLMCGIEKKEFFHQFSVTIEEAYGEVIKKLTALGMMKEEGGRLFFTEEGIDVSNEIFTMFLH